MRTTVTLDRDLHERLRDLAHARGVPFKQAINEAIRAGLGQGPVVPRRFEVEARDLGLRPGVDLTKTLRLAAQLEDDELIGKRRAGR